MNSKQQKVLKLIFANPVSSSMKWDDVESLFVSLGAYIHEGSGSRVKILLNEVVATFHRPHPHKEIDKGAIKSVKRFLENAGVKYEI